jgi:hypothetical protein
MATNNSTSLYNFNSNIKVSPNNFTTLYNSNPSTIVSKDVSDSNFTTLYTQQTTTTATRPYGNANVESFLNNGFDAGGNQVQNIQMSGNLFVSGQSYLGNAGNVHITGGSFNYVLSTNGLGNLFWSSVPASSLTATDYIHFDVTVNGNNQQFTDSNLSVYANSLQMNLFKNGVNIEPFYYQKTANNTVQVDIPLSAGDTIDVLASGGYNGGSGIPGGGNLEVQFSFASTFSGDALFTYDPSISLLTVPNINASNITTTGNLIIQRAYEKYVTVASGTTGTINFNVLNQSILYYTANSTADFTLNIRGNNTTSLNAILPINDTVTIAFLNTVGATPYEVNNFTIDGTSVSPKYINGSLPTSGIRLANSVQTYTYTIMKSAANTYVVLGSLVEYQ